MYAWYMFTILQLGYDQDVYRFLRHGIHLNMTIKEKDKSQDSNERQVITLGITIDRNGLGGAGS
jgi:hypothetical protein